MLQGKCIPLNIKKSNSNRVTCVVFLQLFLFQLHPQFHFADRKTDLLVYFMWKFTYMEKGLPFLLSKITEFISAEDKLYCYKEKLKLLVYIQTLYNVLKKQTNLPKKKLLFPEPFLPTVIKENYKFRCKQNPTKRHTNPQDLTKWKLLKFQWKKITRNRGDLWQISTMKLQI